MKIGNITPENIFFEAPMAGVTDLAFRTLCTKFGAGMTYTEMVSAKALSYNDKKTVELLGVGDEKGIKAIQLFGKEPSVIADAVKKVEPFADIIDINMGCPAPKIVKNGEGSFLMTNPSLAGKIINAAAKNTSKPVTVKIRRGFDTENAAEIAQIAEYNGAAAIAVHGRYALQHYSGSSDLGIIKKVKQSVDIPVIGNGDISSPQDAVNMINETNCDAVMIGRGTLGNPFIFRELNSFFKTGTYELPTPTERLDTALLHIKMLVDTKGEHRAILESRKHVAWYIKGIRGASKIKQLINSALTYEQMKSVLEKAFSEDLT